jgi:hypothetical protein
MESHEIERMDGEADPERCQATTRMGQCTMKGFLLESGARGSYCKLHGGNKTQASEVAGNLRQYRIGVWQAKLERFADSPILKSLRDEIGILRVLLEEKLNTVQTAAELTMLSGPISDLVMKIDKLVTSCHKLEGSMGQHLDKAAIIQLAGQMTSIMSIHLAEQPELLDKIGADFVNLIREQTFGA